MIWETVTFWGWVFGIEWAFILFLLWRKGLLFYKTSKPEGINKGEHNSQEVNNPISPMGIPTDNSPNTQNSKNTEANPKRSIFP